MEISSVPRTLRLEPWVDQRARWPTEGRHVLAQFDESSIVVYQAYRPEIGRQAVAEQRFGGPFFKFERMSWIKTSFLWMMFRSGWGTKENQECVLAIHLRRDAFAEILSQTVPAKFIPELHATEVDWHEALRHSNVRLQWDPDHGPRGQPMARRAIQLGLRGDVLRRFGTEWITRMEDISGYVADQRMRLSAGHEDLLIPQELSYGPLEPAVAARVRVS